MAYAAVILAAGIMNLWTAPLAAVESAGLAISTTQTASINALTQGAANANNGISMLQTTNGALQSVDNPQRIRQLAVEAGDGSFDSNALANLQSEVPTRLNEITRVANQTTFNGAKVLDGIGSVNFQIGAFNGQQIAADLGSQMWDTGSLGVSGVSVSTASGAQAAMSTIDSV
jgi:flagellin